jgi:uncharacterized membrane protein (DUF4010 family)
MSSKTRSKQIKIIEPLVFASVLASSTMFLRVLFEVFVLNNELIPVLVIPLILMSAIGFVWVIMFWKSKEEVSAKIDLKSPFTLKPALTFGIIFAIIIFITKFAERYFGSSGIYVSSFLSGLADVDAVTISMSKFAKTEISNMVAINSIVIACIANTLTKLFISYFFGSKKFFKKISFILGLIILIGITLLIFIQP